MNPPSLDVGAVDPSSLCRECGLCCDWSIFRSAALQASEAAWAVSRRLPLVQHGTDLSFELPCSLLETHGDERICGEYEHRPSACRAFECKVLIGYKRREISHAEALALVRKARALVTKVEEGIDGPRRYESVASKLRALMGGRQPGSPEETTKVETLLDLGVLRALVQRAFHDTKSPKTEPPSDVDTLFARASDQDSWQGLFADGSNDLLLPDAGLSLPERGKTNIELRQKGYTNLGSTLMPKEAAAMSSLVERLAAAGWPAFFLFMHPAVWEIPRRLDPWLRSTLGDDYEILSAFWAWHLAPGAMRSGWRPHRDRPGVSFQEDGTPNSVSVWIALTDATPENGCIYVLPPAFGPHYRRTSRHADVHDVQNVRALPSSAGSALAWNQEIVHWGGRLDPDADRPRISIAFEFQRAGAVDRTSTIDRTRIPSFEERLRLIAEQISRYRHMYPIEDRFLQLALRITSPANGCQPAAAPTSGSHR
jgi:hypothetical protein